MTRSAYSTPEFNPADPLICHSLQLRPAIWSAFFNLLQGFGSEWSWRQDDPTHATVEQVISEIQAATDQMVFSGCTMLGDVKFIARSPAAFELICDGSVYDRVDYPDLYAVLNAAYIIDADTFRVPDLIDKFARGSLTPGSEGGAAQVTLTTTELPAHTHNYDKAVVSASVVLGELPGFEIGDYATTPTSSAGTGAPFSVLNPYHTVIPVIMAAYPNA